MRFVAILIVISASFHSVVAQANDNAYCTDHRIDTAVASALPRLANLSRGVVDKICTAELSSARQISTALVEFLQESAAEFEELDIDATLFPFRAQVNAIKQAVEGGDEIDNIAKPNEDTPALRFSSGAVSITDSEKCNAKLEKARAAGKTTAKNCVELLDSYQSIYSYAQIFVQKKKSEGVKKYLNLAQKDWDDFFVKSRSQTPLELLANSKIWREAKRPGMFLEPPESQLILLHPSIVIEQVPDAVDGSRQKEGILLELVGANWWRREKWHQLSGASLVSLYSDRVGVRGWGHGAALHFGNKFTVGAVSHGGTRGIFLSLDVLDFYKEKRTMIEGYIGALESSGN